MVKTKIWGVINMLFSNVDLELGLDVKKKVESNNKVININNKEISRYKEIGDNIIKSEKLRAKLTKGIKADDPIDDLLLIAIECIGLMTGDKVFTKQNIENLESRA